MVNKKAQILLLILPLLMAASGLVLNQARGPYWLGTNLDPEYVYLLNGLNLAQLRGVGHIDHPGTPVQVLAALTIRAVYLFSGPKGVSLAQDVLTRPEMYLEIINRVFILLNAMMLLVLGLVAYRLTGGFWWSIWLQAAPFFSPVLLQYGLTRVTPEPLLFFASSGVVLLGLLTAFPPETLQKRQGLLVLGWALVVGLGITCKITFLPLLVIPLVVLPRFKTKFLYLVALLVSLLVFTLPIIRMYPLFAQWLMNLTVHTGHYGSGAVGTISGVAYSQNIKTLVLGLPFFAIVLIFSLLILLLLVLWPKWREKLVGSMAIKLLAALLVAQILGLLMVAKHASFHYLLPVLNLSGLMVFLLYAHGKKQITTHHHPGYGPLWAVVFLVFIGLTTLWLNPWAETVQLVQNTTRTQEVSLAIHRQLEEEYGDYAKMYYYRCSAQEYALKFGSDLSRSYHAELLDQLYPHVYFYDIWTRSFSRFDYNRSLSFGTILEKEGNRIVGQGTRGQKVVGVTWRNVASVAGQEGIYILSPQPVKETTGIIEQKE